MTTSVPADPETAAAAARAAGRRRWIALAVVLTAAFMDLVDATIVNIAIPSIQRDTGATFSAVQWVTAGYALAFALGLITGGRLGDIHGRKKLFLLGMGGFTLASALCGFATGPGMLVGARVLQGAMAALMVPQVLAIIHVTFPAHERGKVFGMFGAVIGLGAVCGPLIGALLTEGNLFGLEWRPIFLINLPVGIAGILLGRRFLTESRAPRALRVDLIGTALATAGLLMLLYPLTQGRESGWPLWGFVSMAASPLVLAVLRPLRARQGPQGRLTPRRTPALQDQDLRGRRRRPAGLRRRQRPLLPDLDAPHATGAGLGPAARRADRGAVLARLLHRGRDVRAAAGTALRPQGPPGRCADHAVRCAALPLGGRALRHGAGVLAAGPGDAPDGRRDGARSSPRSPTR